MDENDNKYIDKQITELKKDRDPIKEKLNSVELEIKKRTRYFFIFMIVVILLGFLIYGILFNVTINPIAGERNDIISMSGDDICIPLVILVLIFIVILYEIKVLLNISIIT